MGIVEIARTLGWDLLDLQFTKHELPHDITPDGALLDLLPEEPLTRQLRDMGCPTVRLGRLPHPLDHLLPAVLPDQVAAGRMAAEHFAVRQFRHVGYVGHDPWPMDSCPPLFAAFRDRAAELGCQCHLCRIKEDMDWSGDRKHSHRVQVIGEWLKDVSEPIGLLAFTDAWGATLCTICRQVGLSVPEDVAVLGTGNDIPTCTMSPVDLSSIDNAMGALGQQAARLLHRLMQGKPAPAQPLIIPPASVVVRHSTDVLAVNNPSVAQAMRFIWNHLEQDLSVNDVAREVGLSRRKLERAFQKHLNRGVHAELRRKRLERCCNLLRTTDLKIADLAPKVGFRSADFLHASFKKEFGTTPRTYRLQAAGAD